MFWLISWVEENYRRTALLVYSYILIIGQVSAYSVFFTSFSSSASSRVRLRRVAFFTLRLGTSSSDTDESGSAYLGVAAAELRVDLRVPAIVCVLRSRYGGHSKVSSDDID